MKSQLLGYLVYQKKKVILTSIQLFISLFSIQFFYTVPYMCVCVEGGGAVCLTSLAIIHSGSVEMKFYKSINRAIWYHITCTYEAFILWKVLNMFITHDYSPD